MNEQLFLFDDNTEYEAFEAKFKPKKTTDDCYTPPEVFEVIKDWACQEYGIDPACIVRPFYPGGDFLHFDYPANCVVLDNPPFSILTTICEFYLKRGIPFFLFAPSLTAFSGRKTALKMNHIICDADIIYENGAVVRTAFVTSFGDGIVAQTAPELGRRINEAVKKAKPSKALPKYAYPDHIVTAAMLQKYAHYGIDFSLRAEEAVLVPRLDEQKQIGKSIFGCGFLISDRAAAERAAAERAAAERAAAHVFKLSPRELEIVKT